MAIFNFLFAGVSLLGILGMVTVFVVMRESEAYEEMSRAFTEAGLTGTYLIFIFSISGAALVLQILSGIGYLQQKKFLGRTLGNTYAVISVLSTVVSLVFLPDASGGGFSIITIIALLYPVLTLILLNTTFKEDFIR